MSARVTVYVPLVLGQPVARSGQDEVRLALRDGMIGTLAAYESMEAARRAEPGALVLVFDLGEDVGNGGRTR